MDLCVAVFLPDCTLMWGLHTAQLCRVARDISEPRHSLLCPATSRATDHQPQWGTSIFEGVQHPFLSTPTTSGRFGPAVTDLFHILQWPHGQVLPFREALVQPMLSHISWRRITDQKNTTKFSLQSQQTYKVIISPKGPKLCPQHQLLCAGLLSLSSALQKLWQISCPWQTPRLPQRQGIFDFTATAFLPLTLNLL